MSRPASVAQPRPAFADKLVPAALRLPSNSEYLKHLELSGRSGLIRLASNENTDRPSPAVAEALERSYEDANLSPPPVPPLARELSARHGVETAQVLVTAGSTEVIDAALRTFIRAGDEVLVPAPSWPVCRRRLEVLEAKIIDVPLHRGDERWEYDADGYLEAVSPATKLIYVCSPNNPTGNPMVLADVRRLADSGVPLLVDAAYNDFESGVDVVALVHEYENVIVTRTFSKAYCLAGLRIGYALGAAEIIDYVERLLVPGSAVSSAALHAGLAALRDDAHHARQIARIISERTRLCSALRELGVRVWESHCNFIPVDARDFPQGADGFFQALLAHGIVVRPFEDVVRISIGLRHENDAVIAAVGDVIKQTATAR